MKIISQLSVCPQIRENAKINHNSYYSENNADILNLNSKAKISFKARISPNCTDALLNAWKDPVARDLIVRSIVNGNFKYSPELGKEFVNRLDSLCSKKMSPEKIYEKLEKYFREIKSEIQSGFHSEREERVVRRAKSVKDLVGDFKPESMIDIGCGDGMMTEGIQKAFNLPKDKVTGLEVFVRPNQYEAFNVMEFDGNHLPFPDNSQDFALLFTVLHHVKKPLQYLREINRAMKPGGRIVLREFDAKTKSDRLFNIVMDEMLYKVYTPFPDIPLANTYHGLRKWEKLLEKAGFEIEKLTMNETDNPYRPFMALLRKK